MDLLRRVERFLRTDQMTATRFGRETVRDPRFVFDLRQGREPRAATVRRVQDWLDRRGGEWRGR